MLLLPCFAERVFAGSSYINVFPVKKGCPLATAACKKMCLGSFDLWEGKWAWKGFQTHFQTMSASSLSVTIFKTDYWTSSIDFEIKMLVGQNELNHFNQKYVDFDSLECCVSVHHLILHFTHFEFPANIILWIERKGSGITIILPWSLHNGC